SGDTHPFARNRGQICRYFLESQGNARILTLQWKIRTKKSANGDKHAWLRKIRTLSSAILKAYGSSSFQSPAASADFWVEPLKKPGTRCYCVNSRLSARFIYIGTYDSYYHKILNSIILKKIINCRYFLIRIY
ncbi:MAG: hypothetical protein E6Z15_17710, partial [Paenibacillus macerans]|nr:hypothetical protein [Paenibacillus macerans]